MPMMMIQAAHKHLIDWYNSPVIREIIHQQFVHVSHIKLYSNETNTNDDRNRTDYKIINNI